MSETEGRLRLEINKLRAALRAVIAVTDKTCDIYERDCPGAAECGYWNNDERNAYERAKELAREDRQIPGLV
jgi:hypothetical protein